MMKPIRLTILVLIGFYFAGYSQTIALNTKSFYGIWQNEGGYYNYGGGGFELLYEHALTKGALRGGLEFRTIDWGNQLALNIGYKAPYILKDKWSLSGLTSASFGLALFVNNPLFVYAIDYMPVFTWLRHKRMDFDMGFGIRFTHSPGYSNYGKINQVLDLPLKIGMRYHLDYKK